MKCLSIFAALLFSFSTSIHAAATTAKEDGRVGIGIADQNGSALGISFIPPNEPDWNTKKSGLSISLTKEGKTPNENHEIEAYLIRLDTPFHPVSAYMEQIRKNTQEGYKRNREFRLQAFDTKSIHKTVNA